MNKHALTDAPIKTEDIVDTQLVDGDSKKKQFDRK